MLYDMSADDSTKAAMLLSILPTGVAADIMRELTEQEQRLMTRAIADLNSITPDQRRAVLSEFHDKLRRGEYPQHGGADVARSIIRSAFNDERADEILSDENTWFDSLRDVDESQLVRVLSNEHPQTLAAILSCLDTETASGLLGELDEPIRSNVARRIARLERPDPNALNNAEAELRETARNVIDSHDIQAGGLDDLAAILSRADYQTRQALLKTFEQQDPEFAESLRNELFTFQDLIALPDPTLQTILQQAQNDAVSRALKGVSEPEKESVLNNVSQRRAAMLREAIEQIGPIRRSDVQDARQSLLEQARQLDESGDITLISGDDEIIE